MGPGAAGRQALGTKLRVEAPRAVVPVLGGQVDAADAVAQAMTGEKRDQRAAGALVAGAFAHEKILQEHQPFEIDAGMRDGHRSQAGNLAAGESEREMRVGRAFIGEPLPRRSQHPVVIELRLPVMRRHLAKDGGERRRVFSRRPADVDRHGISPGTWR